MQQTPQSGTNQPEQEKTGPEEQGEKQTPEPQKPQPETTTPQPEMGVKPEIPERQKPEMPRDEGIPKGGPGDQQAQAQPQATTPAQPTPQLKAQTPEQEKKERLSKVKGQLKRPIPTETPREREVSGQLEDWHSNNILNQP